MSVTFADLSRIFEEVQPFENTNGANGRFSYVKARLQDNWYFIKIALSEERQEGLQREFLWSEFMERVDVLMPSLKLDGPKIFKRIGTEALAFHWIDAPLVAEHWDVEAWRRCLDRYAEMHVQLDRAAGDYSLPQVYTSLSHREIAGASWKQWASGHVNEDTLNSAHQLFREHEKQVTFRLQHGDMSPWQIFDVEGSWVIIDGEKAGIDLPRYTDIAQSYVRLHNIAKSPDMARDFLMKVVSGLGVSRDEFYVQFIPVVVIRAIGSLVDADNDHEHDSYKEEARALVDACLSRESSRLFS